MVFSLRRQRDTYVINMHTTKRILIYTEQPYLALTYLNVFVHERVTPPPPPPPPPPPLNPSFIGHTPYKIGIGNIL